VVLFFKAMKEGSSGIFITLCYAELGTELPNQTGWHYYRETPRKDNR
jgi:hypothetical protein